MRRLAVHSDAVTAVAISPDSTLMASVSLDRAAKVFDLGSGKLVATYRDHQNPLYAVAFTPSGREVMSGGRDKVLHQWSIADGKKVREMPVEGDVLKMLVSGEQLFFAGSGRKLVRANIADLRQGSVFDGFNDWVYSVAIHGPTSKVAAGGYDGKVTVWDVSEGKKVGQFSASPGWKGETGAFSKK